MSTQDCLNVGDGLGSFVKEDGVHAKLAGSNDVSLHVVEEDDFFSELADQGRS